LAAVFAFPVRAGRVGITPEAAFELLRRYARSHQEAMRDVSRRVVDGDLPLQAP
jgi:AmiR/NasT family two-component response regulator